MLGINLLLYLLSSREDTVVYCLLRASGEEAAWGRLMEGLGKHACLDVLPSSRSSHSSPRSSSSAGSASSPDPKTLLTRARSTARLHLLPSPSFTLPHLGLSPPTYDLLRKEVDEIIHVAWPVSFNMKLEEFEGFMGFSRGLGELASSSDKRISMDASSRKSVGGEGEGTREGRRGGRGVRYHFVGSTASTYNFPGGVVPERPVGCDVRVSLNQVRFWFLVFLRSSVFSSLVLRFWFFLWSSCFGLRSSFGLRSVFVLRSFAVLWSSFFVRSFLPSCSR
jgi:hypothetical protein